MERRRAEHYSSAIGTSTLTPSGLAREITGNCGLPSVQSRYSSHSKRVP
jgi:hypothetical protein